MNGVKNRFLNLISELRGGLDDSELRPLREGADNCWLLEMDGRLSVNVDFLPRQEVVRFSMAITTDLKPQHYSTLLVYNGLWRRTGGVRMALSDPFGEILQTFETPVEGLTTARMRSVIENLIVNRGAWKELLEAQEGLSGDVSGLTDTLGMRV